MQLLTKTVLVFPIDMDSSRRFIKHARSLGFKVVGASSVMSCAENTVVDSFTKLPFITASEFNQKFIQLIKQQAVTHIYTSHSGVWTHIDNLIATGKLGSDLCLCQPFPFEEDWLEVEPSFSWGEYASSDAFFDSIPDELRPRTGKTLTRYEYASLHSQYTHISGHCDEDKLAALICLLANAPVGDVVEIGALFGRSAFALGWLANRFGIGNMICVDPWDTGKIQHQGKKAEILNSEINRIDFEKVFKSFLLNISVLNNTSYIRDVSAKAIDVYNQAAQQGTLFSTEIKPIEITGKIAVLHIDGNHEYQQVRLDVETWEPKVMSGGWILLDDYEWAFGDGPRLVGNELLESGNYDCSFVYSDTLFLRKP